MPNNWPLERLRSLPDSKPGATQGWVTLHPIGFVLRTADVVPSRAKAGKESSCQLFDRVDARGIERQVILDRGDGVVGMLVRPHRVYRAIAAG